MKCSGHYFLLPFLVLLVSGCVATKKYQDKEGEAARFQKQAAALMQKNQEQQARVNQLEQALFDVTGERNYLQARIDTASKQSADEILRLQTLHETLLLILQDEITRGEITITELKNRLSVNILDKVLFRSGEAVIRDDGLAVLGRVADILKNSPEMYLQITGHTDNVPIGAALKDKFPTNWELSTARATTVARFLIEQRQMSPKRISVAGYSKYKPVASNDTPEGRALNRRIEIKVIAPEN
ncbi:flagellar motor protein MotB [Candidatus Neomarinimicrobiota bacterium]